MTPIAGCVMMVETFSAVTSAPECSISSALVCPKSLRMMRNGSVQSARLVG